MTNEWRVKFMKLDHKQRKEAESVIAENIFSDEVCNQLPHSVKDVLKYYQIKRYEYIPELGTDE